MAKIEIYEKDLTQPDRLEENDNIVFVPGYSLMGPANTPTLCESVKDFESIFGKMPYKFDTDQTISTIKIATKGEYEKSFIYAHELLNLGLPIIFTRFINTTTGTNAKATKSSDVLALSTTVTITAKEYGAYGNKIKCIFDPIKVLGEENPKQFKFTEYIDDGTIDPSKLDPVIISFDVNDEYYFDNTKYKYVDFSTSAGSSSSVTTTSITIQLEDGTDAFGLEDFYKYLNDINNYEFILDKNSCQVKYLTTGSYPAILYKSKTFTDNCAKTLINVAKTRGDSLALLDFNNTSITQDWIETLNSSDIFDSNDSSKYASAFMPWGLYKINSLLDSDDNNLKSILPGSFAYLECLAKSIKTSADWYAVAGVNRGYVSNLIQLENPVTGAISETLQPADGVSVNTILNIRPYGYCIWGNRTLNKNVKNLIASSFLNIRSLTNDVKKLVYRVAKKLTFEQNNNILWLNFKAAIEPTLDKMVSDNGLADYKIIKLTTSKRATIACKIRLIAIEAVEDWDITIELADSYTTVE